jgi:hypothetical protein
MERVLELVGQYQWWLYGLMGAVLLFFLRRALLARQEGARSIFKLEQEQCRTRYNRSVSIAAVIVLLMAAVFVLSNPVLPSAAPETPEPTPTETSGPLLASTLTPTPPPATMTTTPTPTQTRPPRPVRPTETPDLIITETPVVAPAACPNPNVRITFPGVNQAVRGNVSVRGTASWPDFQYYKIEVGQGTNPDQWTVVGQLHQTPVVGGVLETFNSDAYPAGLWTLRLVVVDNTGNYPEPCRVTVQVQK